MQPTQSQPWAAGYGVPEGYAGVGAPMPAASQQVQRSTNQSFRSSIGIVFPVFWSRTYRVRPSSTGGRFQHLGRMRCYRSVPSCAIAASASQVKSARVFQLGEFATDSNSARLASRQLPHLFRDVS